jgi:hypothetical protein
MGLADQVAQDQANIAATQEQIATDQAVASAQAQDQAAQAAATLEAKLAAEYPGLFSVFDQLDAQVAALSATSTSTLLSQLVTEARSAAVAVLAPAAA